MIERLISEWDNPDSQQMLLQTVRHGSRWGLGTQEQERELDASKEWKTPGWLSVGVGSMLKERNLGRYLIGASLSFSFKLRQLDIAPWVGPDAFWLHYICPAKFRTVAYLRQRLSGWQGGCGSDKREAGPGIWKGSTSCRRVGLFSPAEEQFWVGFLLGFLKTEVYPLVSLSSVIG